MPVAIWMIIWLWGFTMFMIECLKSGDFSEDPGCLIAYIVAGLCVFGMGAGMVYTISLAAR